MGYKQGDNPITVNELCNMTSKAVEALGTICVIGEISEQNRSSNGHNYFQLKGDGCRVYATVWANNAWIMKGITDGMEVMAKGTMNFSGKFNKLSLYVEEIKPVGAGKLALEQEIRKNKYLNMGWFDQSLKKPLPEDIRHIGVITSPSGAVIHDLWDVLTRNAPQISVSVFPCMVQGVGAETTIASQIRNADTYGFDLIVVMRGGGSPEDLAPFSTDEVIQAIHYAKTTIISAVGHESDNPLSDLVADIRAGTPSIAGEMICRPTMQRRNSLRAISAEIEAGMKGRLSNAMMRLAAVQNLESTLKYLAAKSEKRLAEASDLETRLKNKVVNVKMNMMGLGDDLDRQMKLRLDRTHQRLIHYDAEAGPLIKARLATEKGRCSGAFRELDVLNPLSILGRGYSMVRTLDGHVITTPQDISLGDTIKITTGGGEIVAAVTGVHK